MNARHFGMVEDTELKKGVGVTFNGMTTLLHFTIM
jgi:hypothetical protein